MLGFRRRAAGRSGARAVDADDHSSEDPGWARKFVERPTNTNVVALVHLYVASRLLEALIERRIINFGEGVRRIEEATALTKENFSFINTLSQSHMQKATDFEEFRVGIQERVRQSAGKLAALLNASETRIGGPKSELAEKLPEAFKNHIALLLSGLDALFDITNPAAEECARVVAERRAVDAEDAHCSFVDMLRDAINRGNGTKSYGFIRIAGYSYVWLGAGPEGRRLIFRRIADAIETHGVLDNSLIRFDDIVIENEQFENLEPLFAGETFAFDAHAAAFCAISEALLAWLRQCWRPVGECVAAVGGGGALIAELNLDPASAAGMEAEDLADLLLRRLKTTLSETGKPVFDPGDRARRGEKVAALSAEIRRFAAALGGFARAAQVAPATQDMEKIGDRGVQAFAAVASETLKDAVKRGAVTLDDRRIRHSERRPAGFDALIGALRGQQRELKAAFFAVDGDRDQVAAMAALDAEFALAERMLTLFSHVAFAAIEDAKAAKAH